VPQQNLSMSK